MLNFLTTNERKNIIIFIHGFIGGKKTWMNGDEPRDFIKFIQQDEEITANFDFAYFDYFTKVTDILERASGILGLFGKKPKKKRNLEIGDISDLLTTEIDARLDAYEKIILVGHSMGGLVAKSYILKSLDHHSKPSRVKLYVSLAVPHNGSDLATLAKIIFSNPQIDDLRPLGKNIFDLNSKWVKRQDLPTTVYYQGKNDGIVPEESSEGYDNRHLDIKYSDDDHSSILSPASPNYIVIVSIIKQLKAVLDEDEHDEEKNDDKINVKVFHFENFDREKGDTSIGQRFAGAILNELLTRNINAGQTDVEPKFQLIGSRQAPPHAEVKEFKEYMRSIIPAVTIHGYIEQYNGETPKYYAMVKLTYHPVGISETTHVAKRIEFEDTLESMQENGAKAADLVQKVLQEIAESLANTDE